MKETLPEKLAAGARAVEQQHAQEVLERKPSTLYELLQLNFGRHLDELIEHLAEWRYDEQKFHEQLDLHKKIIIYFKKLGIDEFKTEALGEFEKYYARILMEKYVMAAREQPVLLEKGSSNIDLELRVVQTSEYFEPDKAKRVAVAEKFVAEYLRRIGGEAKLSIETAQATLPDFKDAEIVNGRYYLLLIFKEMTRHKIDAAKSEIPKFEKELKEAGEKLNDKEARKFDDFVGNLDLIYSPASYHAGFSQYKVQQSIELLKNLKPLP